jgi:hypothetical protein
VCLDILADPIQIQNAREGLPFLKLLTQVSVSIFKLIEMNAEINKFIEGLARLQSKGNLFNEYLYSLNWECFSLSPFSSRKPAV